MNKLNMSEYTISIIIISYNTKDLLQNCIQSIVDKTESVGYEIIVVDNASTDGTQEIIRSNFPQIKFIANKNNIGFGAANNMGIKIAVGKYLFLLNPDTVLTNNAIKCFYDFMENPMHQNVWCCGAALVSKDLKPDITYSNFPSLWQVFFEFGLHAIFRNYYLEKIAIGVPWNHINMDPFDVMVVSGADMFIRRSILDQIGYFDEDFFLYYEETELSWRAHQKGFLSKIIPSIKIIHIGGQSTRNLNLKKIEIFETSRFLFFKKCYGVTIAFIARLLYTLWNLTRYLNRRDSIYLETIRIIWKVA
ncbi:MAG: glycosyltransferase family 2 protein [Sulfuricurvum sp.]|nr:glycosyltransferase family 2 protein [Sulfuricurvum sp.]